MKRNTKHYADEAAHTAIKQHRKNGNHKAYQEEYLFNYEANSEGGMKARKKYNRNEQKKLYLHRLH